MLTPTSRPFWYRTSCLAAAVVAGLAAAAFADEDSRKLADRVPAFRGPIVRGPAAEALSRAGGGGGGGVAADFASKDISLLSWIPLNNFPGGQGSGNDCWGYVSPSGREYAIVGLQKGFGFVEITNPSAPDILTVIPGPSSLWHDVTVIGHYAYGASEAGSGIQIMDMSNIDNGVVTLVKNWTSAGFSTTHTILSNPATKFLYLCGTNVNNGGFTAVNVADPVNPVMAGAWTTRYVHECQVVSYSSGPYAGKEIAFLFTGGAGMSIVDVTNKSNMITLSNPTYPGVQYCHQGWVSDDLKYLYINDELDEGSTVGVTTSRVFDITSLSAPVFKGTFTNGKTAIDHNMYVRGKYIFEGNYRSGLRVFDATNPLSPVEVAWIDTWPGDDNPSFNGVWGNYPLFPSNTVIVDDIEKGLFVLKLGQLIFDYPNGLPTQLEPGAAEPVTVQITQSIVELDPSTVKLFASINGAPYSSVAMAPVGGNKFAANLPAASCFDEVRYYVSAGVTEGWTVTSPQGAPEFYNSAIVQTGATVILADNFQTDKGWTVTNSNVQTGAWARGDPPANGGQGAPTGDADGSGNAFVTGLAFDVDLDGGPTTLTSPVLNLAGAASTQVAYSRWFSSENGAVDTLKVEISNDNGATWKPVGSTGSTGGWQAVSFQVESYVTPTAQVKVRFIASDNPNDSKTEAGIDAFTVEVLECEDGCYPDCDQSGTLDIDDFICFQTLFALSNAAADCDQNGTLDIDDFICFQTTFAVGCP